MPSPFPGMDPFIEGCGLWGDFHPELISEIKRQIAARLPARYVVRQGERSYLSLVGQDGKEQFPFVPDVSLSSPRRELPAASGASPATVIGEEEAVTMEAHIADPFRETFLEILDPGADEQLVTCIEVLSPSNKHRGSEGWALYLRKRQALLLGQANLIEIDLLRGGSRFPMRSPWPDSPYTLLVCRRVLAPTCKAWRGYFRSPLPSIPVPLREPDPDLTLDLQPLIGDVYEVSRYQRSIDYARPITPPLPADDAAWLAEALAAPPR